MVYKPNTKLQLQYAYNDWLNGSIDANTVIETDAYNGSPHVGAGTGPFGHISTWDTSLITDMSQLFQDKPTVIQGGVDQSVKWPEVQRAIGNWDTSKVTNMYMIFRAAQCTADASGIANWDTSKVEDMAGAFFQSQFSYWPELGRWNVGKVTNMRSMFNSTDFNKYIGDWDTSNVQSMRTMFAANTKFNQDIGNWDTGKVENMYGMFAVADATFASFNKYIGGWDTSKVTYMGSMFYNTPFNQNLGGWNIKSVTDMSFIFSQWDASVGVVDSRSIDKKNQCAIETNFKRQKPKLWPYDWDACFFGPQIFLEDKRPSVKKGPSRVTTSAVAIMRKQIKRLPKRYRERGRVSLVPQGDYLQLLKWRAMSR